MKNWIVTLPEVHLIPYRVQAGSRKEAIEAAGLSGVADLSRVVEILKQDFSDEEKADRILRMFYDHTIDEEEHEYEVEEA